MAPGHRTSEWPRGAGTFDKLSAHALSFSKGAEERVCSRRAFLGSAGAGVAGLALAGCRPKLARAPAPSPDRKASAEMKPNVLLILVDDLGYGDLSSYGAPDLRTPAIDGVASSGVRFGRFYANCPVCSPTRASVLTGRFPDLVGVPGVIRTHRQNSWGRLSEDAVMLPQVLAQTGYDTAIIGKWHLGLRTPDTPTERGFAHFRGFLGDMMDDYFNHRRHGTNYMRSGREEIDPEGHATDLFSDWAAEYVRGRAGSERPFFLYLAYNAPHTPIQPPGEHLERVRRREKGISKRRASLVALIEHMDSGIGKVLDALRESGLERDTLVLFTSDNGGQLGVGARNGPLRGGKGQMYEGGIRVPMCARWPGRIAPGSRSAARALTMDLFPTICEAAGAGTEHEIDGRSFLPTLLGESQREEERALFWVRREGGKRYRGKAFYAARRGDWKLLQNAPAEEMRLFNLKEDPGETRPLGEDHPRHAELREALRAHVEEAAKVPWQPREA
jgi:arylsulfatase A-like enzyme